MTAATRHAPTSEQLVALDLFATGKSLAIEAGAGTGKTTALQMLAESDYGRVRRGQYLAFNKAIVTEASQKFGDNVACNTAHSLAFRAVGKRYAHRLKAPRMKSTDLARRLRVDPITVTVQDGESKRLGAPYLAGVVMLAIERFCQSADAEPTAKHVPYLNGIDIPPGNYENNNQVARALVPAMRRAWADLADPKGSLPFKHSHYLKAWQLSGPRIDADFILFDEAQDANPVMVAIVAAQTHAQLVWVGDSQQQIYTFTGAVNALASVGAEQTAYLTQSFRFGPAIAEVANSILDALDADLRLTGTEAIESSVAALAEPHAILTRTNAAAVKAVFAAQDDGRTVHLVGGGGEVVNFAKAARDLMTNGWTSHPELACFDSWAEVQDYVAQDEQGGDLRLMVSLVDEFGVETILSALGNMPREEDADLIVSTAHKSKGREWDTVRLGGDFPVEPTGEELRLLYVACTRAKLILDIGAVGYLSLGLTDAGEGLPKVAPTPPPATPPAAPVAPAADDTECSPDEDVIDCDESVLAELDDSADPQGPFSLKQDLAGRPGSFEIIADGNVIGTACESRMAIEFASAAWRSGNYGSVYAWDAGVADALVIYDH